MASSEEKAKGSAKKDSPKAKGAAIVADLAELLDPSSGHSLVWEGKVLRDEQRSNLLAHLRDEAVFSAMTKPPEDDDDEFEDEEFDDDMDDDLEEEEDDEFDDEEDEY